MKTSHGTSFWSTALLVAVGLLGACSRSEPDSRAQEPAVAPPSAHRTQEPSIAPPLTRPLPPYHGSAEAAKPFPRLMPVERYRDFPVVARAYEIAHRIPEVLAQQPCFCYCDKFGHGSLLDCFASDHGAG